MFADLNDTLEAAIFRSRDLTMRYVSSLEGKGDSDDYEALYALELPFDWRPNWLSGTLLSGRTGTIWRYVLDGREIRVYGSSGQQRSALLLLDLAAISLYNLTSNDHPVFVIDDVDAELDEGRIRHLLEYLENRTQTFITTSKRSHVEGFFSRANVYEIEDGKVVAVSQK